MAHQVDRNRLGCAGLATRMAWTRPVSGADPGGGAGVCQASVPLAWPTGGIRLLAAATLLEHGSEAQKGEFLRRILTGQDVWCQLFSEPGSGSDLAGALTRAELDGERWIVNGQKVWTTSAHHADWGLLLARTDWDAPKHQGLSYFVIDMRQPGVEVQPLKQMNGHASFNQVFFNDAEVKAEHLVGQLGQGWARGHDHLGPRAPPGRRLALWAGRCEGPGGAPRNHPRGGSPGNSHRDGTLQVVSAARRTGRFGAAEGFGQRAHRESCVAPRVGAPAHSVQQR